MNVGRGRARRPDDWPSSHVRARADLSDRLDWPLDPTESAWLDAHLDACPDCRSIAAAYAAQRLELRALRDRTPVPPRDLWARTAAAIESESRFRDNRSRTSVRRGRRSFAPTALLAAALVVVVAVGLLTSSRQPFGGDDAGSSAGIAGGVRPSTFTADASGATPTLIPVTERIAFVARDPAGSFSIKTKSVDRVCPTTSPQPCEDTNATVDRPVDLDQNATTVFGSADDQRLIVGSTSSGTLSVVPLASEPPTQAPTPTPTVATASPSSAAASAGSSANPSTTPASAPASPPSSATPSPSATPSSSDSPTPSVAVTPSPSGAIEIASDVVLVGQSAAYSPDGGWFAFTARPVNGSAGPDIFVWKVGDPRANRVTDDHRSVFGSWSNGSLVASTLVQTTGGPGASAGLSFEPASFLLDPASHVVTSLPQAGLAWRPAIDPTGRLAVYWAGTVRSTAGPGFAPDNGRLVLGDWSGTASAQAHGPLPTALTGDQTSARHETTIDAGRMDDWDARWDPTGTRLAVWIADRQNPAVGKLSLYAVDSFDGKIDLKNPLLDPQLAVAGYRISDGQLVWAEPSDGGSTGGRIQLLAWTDVGVGTVGTVTGPVIVIR